MPHLTFEYTVGHQPKIAFDELFARMHTVLAEVGRIEIGNCKSRATELKQFYIGDGAGESGFVHLEVRFLEGRSAGKKREIGLSLLELVRGCYAADVEASNVQITVEVRDIERAMYFKVPELGGDDR
ncbi:MAG: hypothetical protein HKM89_12900 [Gemmatimonadales bacterium]|nr:hypothetical protein [Gemmatimonadales bacterium]